MQYRVPGPMERAILWPWLRQVSYGVQFSREGVGAGGIVKSPPTEWMIADQGKAILAAVGATVGTGRMARTWPAWHNPDFADQQLQRLYATLHTQLRKKADVACLVWPGGGVSPQRHTWELAGYRWAADIDCLAGPVEVSTASLDPTLSLLHFHEVSDSPETCLADIYSETLLGSTDCVGWHDPRPVGLILRGLGGGRQTRSFQLVLNKSSLPIGCLVLSHDGLRDHADLEYLGLIPSARGKKLGNELLRQARCVAHGWRCRTLGVQVDRANTAALRMYARNQFYPWSQHALFSAIL